MKGGQPFWRIARRQFRKIGGGDARDLGGSQGEGVMVGVPFRDYVGDILEKLPYLKPQIPT